MTERTALRQTADRLEIGPSALAWDGSRLVIDIAEITAPIPSRLAGRVVVTPAALTWRSFGLDSAARHRWSPIAPACRVEVTMHRPALSWSGTGYLDSNEGDVPLERDFLHWDWLRAPRAKDTVILYNAARREGGELSLALGIGADGVVAELPVLPRATLPPTLWRMRPQTRCDPATTPTIRQRLEDAPFYSRSVLQTELYGEPVRAVHEHLSLPRFTAPWVQAMLPFRIPRRR